MTTDKRCIRWAALAVVLDALLPLTAYAGGLRVGAGKASITPSAANFPYLPSDAPSLNTGPGERSFVGVHDEVYARALVIDDGARRVALVVLEVTAVPMAEELVKAVAQQIGVPESNVMVAATHTHSVPLFSYAGGKPNSREAQEIRRIKQGALDAVHQATAHLQPARVAFARGTAWVNVNNGEESGSKGADDPLGPSDKSLDVVRFDTDEGVPIALLVNYASHAEVMFRSVTKNDGYEVSGDLPGAVSRLLEVLPQAAPIVLFTSGAEADQLPLFKSLQSAGSLPAADEGAGGWALLDALARRLAGSVMGVVSGMPPGVAQAHIDAAAGSVTCPGQQLRIDSQSGQAMVEDRPPVIIPLSVIRIDDIVLAGVGGDVASEIGQHFKASSPFADSTLISMAGASIGYIFSDAGYEHPGHGLTKSLLKPHCADGAVVNGLVQLINGRP
jgi:neutral ceramidase